jgi:hypothetical protein
MAAGCPDPAKDSCLSHRLLLRILENNITSGNSGAPALDEVPDFEIGHLSVEGAQRA